MNAEIYVAGLKNDTVYVYSLKLFIDFLRSPLEVPDENIRRLQPLSS
jgi:hypothetical protein